MSWLTSRQWTIKNLLEIKVGQRVLIENNVFENNWLDAQTGRALLFRAADQESAAWSRTSDITVRHNVVRNSSGAVSIDAQGLVETTRRMLVEQNLFTDIGTAELSGTGSIFEITGAKPMQDIVITRNTAMFSRAENANRRAGLVLDGGRHVNLSFTDNVLELGAYGVKGSGASSGLASFERYSAPGRFTGNLFVGGGAAAAYGTANATVASLELAGFANPLTGDYRLALARPSATGVQPGADVTSVLSHTQGARSGTR
jgi:hypothetical protein